MAHHRVLLASQTAPCTRRAGRDWTKGLTGPDWWWQVSQARELTRLVLGSCKTTSAPANQNLWSLCRSLKGVQSSSVKMVSAPCDYLKTVPLGRGASTRRETSGMQLHRQWDGGAGGQLEGRPEITSSVDLFQQCQNSSLKKKLLWNTT